MIGTAQLATRKVGGVFTFQPDPTVVNGTPYNWPLFQINCLTKRDLKVDRGIDDVMDDTNGTLVPVDSVPTKYVEGWDFTTENVGIYLMALLFGSPPPVPWTQATATMTDVPHVAFTASALEIKDANQNPQRMLAGITNVKVGATTAVAGTFGDYSFAQEDLDRGVIATTPVSTLFTPAALASSNVSGGGIACTVSYALAAASGYELAPLGSPCTVKGYGAYHASSCDNQFAMPIEGRYSVVCTDPAFPLDKAATINLTCKRLANPGATRPMGRVRVLKGAL